MQVAWLLPDLYKQCGIRKGRNMSPSSVPFLLSLYLMDILLASRSSSITPSAYIILASLSVIPASHLSTNRQHGLSSYIHLRSLSRPYRRLKRSDRITFSYLGTRLCKYELSWLPHTLNYSPKSRQRFLAPSAVVCAPPSDEGSGEVQGV